MFLRNAQFSLCPMLYALFLLVNERRARNFTLPVLTESQCFRTTHLRGWEAKVALGILIPHCLWQSSASVSRWLKDRSSHRYDLPVALFRLLKLEDLRD